MHDQIDASLQNSTELPGESGGDAIAEQTTAENIESEGEDRLPGHGSQDADPNHGSYASGAEATSPPEDSEEQQTLKEEASTEPPESKLSPKWKADLKIFHEDMNGVLATKENLKLVSVDKKLHPAYIKNWTGESNRYFQLVVHLRRRSNNVKIGGKTVA